MEKQTQLTYVYSLAKDGVDISEIRQLASKPMQNVIEWYLDRCSTNVEPTLDEIVQDYDLDYLSENSVNYDDAGMIDIIWVLNNNTEIAWNATTGEELDASLIHY